jgi:hypothetical protein
MPEPVILQKKIYELGIEPSEIIGYMSPGEVTDIDFFTTLAASELKRLSDQTVIGGYMVHPASLEDKMLKTSNAVFDVGNDVSLMLKSVEKIAVFACTVSSELNEVLENEKNSADLLQSYLLDIIGTVIAGKIADVLHQNITQKFSNVNVTNTISPGNCGWPVEDQKKLFSLLPPGFLNISLNPSGMMYPVKSLTGMIGIGTKVKFKQTECRYCRSRNCPYRKEEYAG